MLNKKSRVEKSSNEKFKKKNLEWKISKQERDTIRIILVKI